MSGITVRDTRSTHIDQKFPIGSYSAEVTKVDAGKGGTMPEGRMHLHNPDHDFNVICDYVPQGKFKAVVSDDLLQLYPEAHPASCQWVAHWMGKTWRVTADARS